MQGLEFLRPQSKRPQGRVGVWLGITSAKLLTGRWRIFGLRPPELLLFWNTTFQETDS